MSPDVADFKWQIAGSGGGLKRVRHPRVQIPHGQLERDQWSKYAIGTAHEELWRIPEPQAHGGVVGASVEHGQIGLAVHVEVVRDHDCVMRHDRHWC